MKWNKRKNTAKKINYLKSEVIPTRKCAKVPIKPTREAVHRHRRRNYNPKFKKGK